MVIASRPVPRRERGARYGVGRWTLVLGGAELKLRPLSGDVVASDMRRVIRPVGWASRSCRVSPAAQGRVPCGHGPAGAGDRIFRAS